MIIGFAGIPGTGKSYEAAKKILENLRLGRRVYTNLDGLDTQECQRYLQDLSGLDDYNFARNFIYLSRADVYRFWEIAKPGSLIVLDEMHKHFNARNWQSKDNGALADWASTHRHHGYDVIAITQDMEKLEKQFRTLIEWTYVYRKVNFLGSLVSKKYLVYTYSGCDHDGKPLATNCRTYDPRIFHIYKSYFGDAKEVGVMKHLNVLRHPVIYAVPVVLAVFVYLAFYKSSIGTGDLFGSKAFAAKVEASKKTMNPQPKVVSTPIPVQSPMSTASIIPVSVVQDDGWRRYRIEGYVTMGLKRWVYVNGVKLRGGDPDLRNVDYQQMICEGKIDRFGVPREEDGSVQRQQTADLSQKSSITYIAGGKSPGQKPDMQKVEIEKNENINVPTK